MAYLRTAARREVLRARLKNDDISPGSTYQWSIAGGTPIDAATVAGTLTYSAAGLLQGGSLSLADAANGVTSSAAYSASTQTITGTVVQNATGATIASYSVNLVGTGTIAYSNGLVGTIANWAVQG